MRVQLKSAASPLSLSQSSPPSHPIPSSALSTSAAPQQAAETTRPTMGQPASPALTGNAMHVTTVAGSGIEGGGGGAGKGDGGSRFHTTSLYVEDSAADLAAFEAAVLKGLADPKRNIPQDYCYDDTGSGTWVRQAGNGGGGAATATTHRCTIRGDYYCGGLRKRRGGKTGG